MLLCGCCIFIEGNYGNTLDTSVPPSSSTTNPTNAVFDGCHYYYLPWSDSKPCVSVDSHWEDIAFRFEPLNILTRMCERLVCFYFKIANILYNSFACCLYPVLLVLRSWLLLCFLEACRIVLTRSWVLSFIIEATRLLKIVRLFSQARPHVSAHCLIRNFFVSDSKIFMSTRNGIHSCEHCFQSMRCQAREPCAYWIIERWRLDSILYVTGLKISKFVHTRSNF